MSGVNQTTKVSDLEVLVRQHLIESSPRFWSSDEIRFILKRGVHDLWRDVVDLKQDHFLKIDNQSMVLPPNSNYVTGVPNDLHKIFNIEPANLTVNSPNVGLLFQPLPYNDRLFQFARTEDPINPQNDAIYYTIHGQGGPVNSPQIFCAPQVSSTVPLSVAYVPTLDSILVGNWTNPIPGESDNALVAWGVAYARAKEREDRAPDPGWIAIYTTEKAHVLQSLGIRQYQELPIVKTFFEEYW